MKLRLSVTLAASMATVVLAQPSPPTEPAAASRSIATPSGPTKRPKLSFIRHIGPAAIPVEPQPSPPEERLRGTVLAWADATFFLGPTETAQSVQLARFTGSRRDHIGEVVPLRVVAARGAMVEVKTPRRDATGNYVTDCAWFGVGAPNDFDDLRLFVRRSDLAPVVRSPHAQAFPDGSAVYLAPGTPVLPLSAGGYLASLLQTTLTVPLPAAVVGYSYTTIPTAHAFEWSFSAKRARPVLREAAVRAVRWEVRPGSTASFAGASFDLSERLRFLAEQIERRGNLTLAASDARCGAMVISAPAASIESLPADQAGATDGGMGMGIGTLESAGEIWYLEAGTPLATKPGFQITRARKRILVKKPASGTTQVCIERSLHITSSYLLGPILDDSPAAPLQLCAPVTAIKYRAGRTWQPIGR